MIFISVGRPGTTQLDTKSFPVHEASSISAGGRAEQKKKNRSRRTCAVSAMCNLSDGSRQSEWTGLSEAEREAPRFFRPGGFGNKGHDNRWRWVYEWRAGSAEEGEETTTPSESRASSVGNWTLIGNVRSSVCVCVCGLCLML